MTQTMTFPGAHPVDLTLSAKPDGRTQVQVRFPSKACATFDLERDQLRQLGRALLKAAAGDDYSGGKPIDDPGFDPLIGF